MHMADALISPAVGATAWAATAGLIRYSSRKLKKTMDDHRIPLMGVMGAFIFAAQMINFTIPATGSSGHLGGGLILAIVLGPYAGFLTLASVLIVQALFFADGGLLALGCNILNLGFFPCFVAYPWIYRKITDNRHGRGIVTAGALAASVAGLQLGSLAVVLETLLSGISELHLGTFLMLMQPVHLAIGVVEGIATAAVVLFVSKVRPEVFEAAAPVKGGKTFSTAGLLAAFLAAALVLGAGVSWLASTYPDGLEWSVQRAGIREGEQPGRGSMHRAAEKIQGKTSILPDYDFRIDDGPTGTAPSREPSGWPTSGWGTPVSGLVGGGLTLIIAGAVGLFLHRRRITHR